MASSTTMQVIPVLTRLQRGTSATVVVPTQPQTPASTQRPVVAKKRLPCKSPVNTNDKAVSKFFEDEAECVIDAEEEEEDEDEEMRDFIIPNGQEEPEPSSASESESDSDAGEKKKRHHRHSKRSRSTSSTRSRSRSPKTKSDSKKKAEKQKKKKDKADRLSEDAKMQVPLPIVRYLQQHQTRKVCGRCEECRKPPCGVCSQCLHNIKNPKPAGVKDRRRCEMLTCKNVKVSQPPLAAAALEAPQVQSEREVITKQLQETSEQLGAMSLKSSEPDYDENAYNNLVEKMRTLYSSLEALKANGGVKHKKSKFPPGFHVAYSVIGDLEKKRLKFAKFVVKGATSGDDCRSIAERRQMRDELDDIILKWCSTHESSLTPLGDTDTFSQLLLEKRPMH